MKKFTRRACEQLGHYVYLYIDPRDRRVFYVGKGSGNRCFAHRLRPANSRVGRIIREIRASKREPVIDILKHGLSESQALLVESTAIDLLDIKHLAIGVRDLDDLWVRFVQPPKRRPAVQPESDGEFIGRP